MAFQTLAGAIPYLFFKKANDNCITVRADKLLMIRKKTSTLLSLVFDGSVFKEAGLNKLGTVAVPDAWYHVDNIEVKLNVATGKGDEVSKSIIAAINSPVSVGDPNARFDRGYVVVADVIASSYVDVLITGVDSINVDTRTDADLSGNDITA